MILVKQRVATDCLELVDTVTWNKYKEYDGADGDVPERGPAEEVTRGGQAVNRKYTTKRVLHQVGCPPKARCIGRR